MGFFPPLLLISVFCHFSSGYCLHSPTGLGWSNWFKSGLFLEVAFPMCLHPAWRACFGSEVPKSHRPIANHKAAVTHPEMTGDFSGLVPRCPVQGWSSWQTKLALWLKTLTSRHSCAFILTREGTKWWNWHRRGASVRKPVRKPQDLPLKRNTGCPGWPPQPSPPEPVDTRELVPGCCSGMLTRAAAPDSYPKCRGPASWGQLWASVSYWNSVADCGIKLHWQSFLL